MATTQSVLTITYTGEPVAVNPAQITEAMFVPNVDRDPLRADESPGRVGAALIQAAEAAKALLIPSGIAVECNGDDDEDGGGIILEVYPTGNQRIGMTCGWYDIGNLARRNGDSRADNDPGVVAEALAFIAGELNQALGAGQEPHLHRPSHTLYLNGVASV